MATFSLIKHSSWFLGNEHGQDTLIWKINENISENLTADSMNVFLLISFIIGVVLFTDLLLAPQVLYSFVPFHSNIKKLYHFFTKRFVVWFYPPRILSFYGEWAIIYNSSFEFGDSICDVLASRGIRKVVLINNEQIDNNDNKINKEEDNANIKYSRIIQRHHEVYQCQVLSHDLSTFSFNEQSKLTFQSKLEYILGKISCDGGIGILVNCIEDQLSPSSSFSSFSFELQSKIIKMNPFAIETFLKLQSINQSGLLLTMQSVLPHMQFRASGAIIMIGSSSNDSNSCILESTKIFGRNLVNCMYHEHKNEGIDCLNIMLPKVLKYGELDNEYSNSDETSKASQSKEITNFIDMSLNALSYQSNIYQ